MPEPQRPTSETGARLLATVLAAIVLGIAAMQALSHCPGSAQALPFMGPSMGSVAAGGRTAAVAAHAHDGMVAAEATISSVIATAAGLSGSGGLGDILMICAAMLIGVGAVLALALQRRSRAFLVSRRLRSVRWRSPLPPTGTGPPSVWAFTVIRC